MLWLWMVECSAVIKINRLPKTCFAVDEESGDGTSFRSVSLFVGTCIMEIPFAKPDFMVGWLVRCVAG